MTDNPQMNDMSTAGMSHNRPMTDTTERDRLVELLGGHDIVDFTYASDFKTVLSTCRCGSQHLIHREHLADVLIANSWSRTVQRPEVDAEVEWGVRYQDGSIEPFGTGDSEREAAKRWAGDDSPVIRRATSTVMCRTVGPWQEAQ